MGAIVYGAAHGEYSDYRVAALFESEEKARKWIAGRAKVMICPSCKGTGKWDASFGTRIVHGDSDECYRCEGVGKIQGDGNHYHVEKFPWNPRGKVD